MKLSRDISGDELIDVLVKIDYQVIRQTGSHIRLSNRKGEKHNITIPRHKYLKIGTLHNILNDVANHLKISRDELISLCGLNKR